MHLIRSSLVRLAADQLSALQINDQYVYDSGSLAWVPMIQPTSGGIAGTADQGVGGASPWLIHGAVDQNGTWTVQPGNTANTTPWLVKKVGAVLTASAPATATVGTSSAQALAANSNRTGLAIINVSANTVSFGLGATAVLNNGITLTPNGSWVMDDYTYSSAAITAIASSAGSVIAIQEFT